MNLKLIITFLGLLTAILAFRVGAYLITAKPFSPNTKISFEARIQNQPKLTAGGQQVSLSLPNSQRVIVKFGLTPRLSYGDIVNVEGKIKYFKTESGAEVAYMNTPKFVLIKQDSKSNLIYRVRQNIISFFNSSLKPIDSALMLGIVFGIKQTMPNHFNSNLQKTGLLHVIAASGMNITMVGGFLLGIFTLFLRRQLALIFTILGILFYALLAGMEASIVRAAIMGILVLIAQLLGRQSSAYLGLFGAGFLMLFLNPGLIFDIGFQLSFMATFGLIYVRPIFFLSSRLKRLVERFLIGEDVVTTLTAQLVTMPILLLNFGTYSIFSILVNAVLLWTVPILMIIGGLSAIFGLIFEPIGRIISYLSLPFLLYFEKTVDFFGNTSAQIELKTLPISIIPGYYLLLFSFVIYLKRRNLHNKSIL